MSINRRFMCLIDAVNHWSVGRKLSIFSFLNSIKCLGCLYPCDLPCCRCAQYIFYDTVSYVSIINL